MKVDDLAEALAPVAPPCFSTRTSWVEYVRAAAAGHHQGDAPGPIVFTRGVIALRAAVDLAMASKPVGDVPPLLIHKGKAVRFNPEFDFCEECDRGFQFTKQREGKCKPLHLHDLLKGE